MPLFSACHSCPPSWAQSCPPYARKWSPLHKAQKLTFSIHTTWSMEWHSWSQLSSLGFQDSPIFFSLVLPSQSPWPVPIPLSGFLTLACPWLRFRTTSFHHLHRFLWWSHLVTILSAIYMLRIPKLITSLDLFPEQAELVHPVNYLT